MRRRLRLVLVGNFTIIGHARIVGLVTALVRAELRVGMIIVDFGCCFVVIGVAGVARRLRRPGGRCAEIMYLADPVDSARAREMGLVHKVVPDNNLGAAATAWAEKIAGNAPLSVRAMKQMISRVISEAFEVDHKDLDELGNKVRTSQDAKEGVRAFLEKRKPVWRGE